MDAAGNGETEQDLKGQRFLELIDEQNRVMWKITAKLSLLIGSGWSSAEHKEQLESLMRRHSEIIGEIDAADKDRS